jgi:hypothetical protein
MAEPLLSPDTVDAVRFTTAALGTLLLAARAWLTRREPAPARLARGLDAALALLGVLAAAGYWNLFQFHYPNFGHPSDTFHYFVGGKYWSELGHTRLYRCTAIADAESGHGDDVARRYLRNLETNEIERAVHALTDPGLCKDHFSPERWAAFKADVGWFRDRLAKDRWYAIQIDHGYNGTPVWLLVGGSLANTGPATKMRILLLRLLDPLLLAAAWGAVAWSFGWRVACVGLLYWGTNYPNQYGWVGGSFLREIDVAALLAGLALLHRQRAFAGGFALAFAALLRIYPVVVFAGPGLQVALGSWRARRLVLSPEARRFALGGLAAAALLLPAAAVATGGFDAWRAFAENTRLQSATPMRNHFGLRTLLSWRPDEPGRALRSADHVDPYDRWKESRRRTFAQRRVLYGALVAGAFALLALAARGQPLWAGAVLAAGLIPILGELTSYYATSLAVFALLWQRWPAIGIGIVALSALGWMLVSIFHVYDRIFVAISLATVLFVAFAWLWAWRVAPRDPT